MLVSRVLHPRSRARQAKQNAVLNRILYSLSVALRLGELGAFAVSLGRFPKGAPRQKS